jgi:hypothetical protein
VGVCDLELGGSAILLPWWRRYEGSNTKCDREWRRADVNGQSRLPFRGVSLLFALRDPQNLTTLSIRGIVWPGRWGLQPVAMCFVARSELQLVGNSTNDLA